MRRTVIHRCLLAACIALASISAAVEAATLFDRSGVAPPRDVLIRRGVAIRERSVRIFAATAKYSVALDTTLIADLRRDIANGAR